MLRAVVLAARLDFTIDPPILEAIARHREAIGLSAPARLMEEHYKILRSGASERVFKMLGEVGLLQHIAPPLVRPTEAFWSSLRRLDAYRRRFASIPDTLTNSVLVGSLLYPIGALGARPRRPDGAEDRPRGITLGLLPIPKRDVERLRHLMAVQRRLLELDAPQRVQRGLLHRHVLPEAVTWLEIHGERPDAVEHWRALLLHAPRTHHTPDENADGQPHAQTQMAGDDQRPRRRRRRRGGRRRRHRQPQM
jgi:poly(A) polymerase